jgi:hypothetical protein
MTCPRCSAPADDGALDCPSCGIVFAKWRPRTVRERPAPPPPQTLGIPHAGWKAAGLGLVFAIALSWFPFLSFILSPLTTMVHEIGHTAVLWLFGYPAIPAFDFANGGGVTMSDLERSTSVVAAWAIGLVAMLWWQRGRKGVVGLLVVAAILYAWSYDTTRETLAVTLGGHGGEIAFGTLFLYRGLTGWGCKIEAERPIYAFLAFMILFSGLRLAISLQGDSMARYWYLQGKGGIDHDLVTGAQILSLRLENLARLMVFAELLAIPAAFWAAAQRKAIGAVSEDEEEV